MDFAYVYQIGGFVRSTPNIYGFFFAACHNQAEQQPNIIQEGFPNLLTNQLDLLSFVAQLLCNCTCTIRKGSRLVFNETYFYRIAFFRVRNPLLPILLTYPNINGNLKTFLLWRKLLKVLR